MIFKIVGRKKGKNRVLRGDELIGMLEDSDGETDWEVVEVRR
jgi:hypothetical protein